MENIDVVILCGGQGKRLRKVVSDRPKAMAEINGRPFLDILIDYATAQGARRFILCAGHMSDYITNYYKNDKRFDFIISKEEISLGTAGAIKNAESFIQTDPFLVMNGDSFCLVNMDNFLSFHKNKTALASIVVVKKNDTVDFGTLILDDSQKVIEFTEKNNAKGAFVNAGIYLFGRDVLFLVPLNTNFSLERNLFPKLVNKLFFGFITSQELIDIGTPQRYEYAKTALIGQNRIL